MSIPDPCKPTYQPGHDTNINTEYYVNPKYAECLEELYLDLRRSLNECKDMRTMIE